MKIICLALFLGLGQVRSEVIESNEQWRPLAFTAEIESGSVFDFSAMREGGPAGKDGFVIVTPNGNLAAQGRPEKRLRFFGANVCFSVNFMSHEESDTLAERFTRMGYNSVRIHHYDAGLVGENDRGSNSVNSFSIRPEPLERLDYFFAALKKRGIYITTDFFTYRNFSSAEVPEWGKPFRMEVKALIPLYDSAIESWKKFVSGFLDHVNPYTGLSYKNDPALYSICMVNEDTIFDVYKRYPEIKALYEARFGEWLARKGLPAEDPNVSPEFAVFLIELQNRANEKMAAYLRSIGVRALLTGANHWDLMATAAIRDRFDYADSHGYWDHPTFGKGVTTYNQTSHVSNLGLSMRIRMPARILGKPFLYTEYNHCPPNQFRAEAGPLMGSVFALQDWDGVYRFDYASLSNRALDPGAMGGKAGAFGIAGDPIGLLTERMIALFFGRGDVSAAKTAIAYGVSETSLHSTNALRYYGAGSYPDSFTLLGLHAKIGTVYAPEFRKSAGPKDAWLFSPEKISPVGMSSRAFSKVDDLVAALPGAKSVLIEERRFSSDTGEIWIDGNKSLMKVMTPKSEALVLAPGKKLSGKFLEAEGEGFSVVFVAAVDGLGLKDSRRLLLIHLTDALNTGMSFTDASHRNLEKWGDLPHLVRAGKTRLHVEVSKPAEWKVWAVDLAGRHIRETVFESAKDGLRFTANTAEAPGSVLAYELRRP